MASSSSKTEIAQWCLVGVAGCSSLLCLVPVVYAIRAGIDSSRLHRTLYIPRIILGVCSIVLCGIQVLPALVALYGYSPTVLCGIYTCLTFGFLYPLVHWTVICMLLHTVEKYDSCIASREEKRVTGVVNKSILYSLPSIVGQSVVAWIGLGFQNSSHTVQDYLLSTSYSVPCRDMSEECKVCLFPGISLFLQTLLVLVSSVVLHRATADVARIVINMKLKRKVWMYYGCSNVCMWIGIACMGAAVGVSPITTNSLMWVFAGTWIGTVVFLFALHCTCTCYTWIFHSLYEARLAMQSKLTVELDLMRSQSDLSSIDEEIQTPVTDRRASFEGVPRSHSDHGAPRAKDVLLRPQELASVMSGNRTRRRWSSYGEGYVFDDQAQRHFQYDDQATRGRTLPQNLSLQFVDDDG